MNLISGVSHAEALESLRTAMIVVDQLNIGWYGMVALECMAMKVPVMCYIRDDLKDFISVTGYSPILYTSKETIEPDLLSVLSTPQLVLQQQAEEGYEYVTAIHSPRYVTATLLHAIGGKTCM